MSQPVVPESHPGDPGPMFPFRTVVLGAFLPSLAFDVGLGAMLPIIAVTATRLGATLTVAGLITALIPVGKIVADLPAGALAARLGDRRAMVGAGWVAVGCFAGLAATRALWCLALGVFLLGAASAVFNLARQAYLTEVTPPLRRARVLSTLAGVHRIGLFIGPFAGAAAIAAVSLHAAYWLGAIMTVLSVVILHLVRDEPHESARLARADAPRLSVWAVAVRYRHLFGTLGMAVLLLAAVRGARQTVIPLWGEHLGLDAEVTSMIFGLSGALDMLFFYPAGKVMDRFGRLWIAMPSMITMSVALAALPFTHTVAPFAVVAAVLGVGNGMGSGIVMTLGADTAPPEARPAFLGVWRLFQDTGDALGPLILSGGAALGSLAAGIWATATLGAGATGALARWVPKYSPLANLVTRRRRSRE